MRSHSPLKLGTAGWAVPAQHALLAVSDGSHLERYARCFNAVEINSSFHRSHQAKTYERWARSTPEGFRFAVKIPKSISHEHQLQDCSGLLDRFAAEVDGLGSKLGVVLLQLPPRSVMNKRIADRFLRALRGRIDAPVAIEPRHASWFAPGIGSWLADREVARVAADPARVEGAGFPGGWRGLVYYRWHGAPRTYYSSYEQAALAGLQQRLSKAARSCLERWCIFDNTAAGAAFLDALRLSDLLPTKVDRVPAPTHVRC